MKCKYCMFVKRHFTYIVCAYLKKCYDVKFSEYYFHVKAKTLADFQICLSVPFINTNCKKIIYKKDFFCFSCLDFGFTSIKDTVLNKGGFILKNTCHKCLIPVF